MTSRPPTPHLTQSSFSRIYDLQILRYLLQGRKQRSDVIQWPPIVLVKWKKNCFSKMNYSRPLPDTAVRYGCDYSSTHFQFRFRNLFLSITKEKINIVGWPDRASNTSDRRWTWRAAGYYFCWTPNCLFSWEARTCAGDRVHWGVSKVERFFFF